jgi:large subunit ribosomal protein L6
MPRIGKRQLEIPSGVEVKVDDGVINVKGPKGSLSQSYLPVVKVEVKDKKVATICEAGDPGSRALQGLYNSLIKNMLVGVTAGFAKELDLVGVGYRAQMQGKKLSLQLGYSHPMEIDPPAGVEFEVAGGTRIKIKGVDRQVVGEVAAKIRKIREVEPYKGKGIRYFGEHVRRKAGKAAKAGAGAAGA